jgi:hypothetical protein
MSEVRHSKKAENNSTAAPPCATIDAEKELQAAVDNARSAFLNLARQMEIISKLLPRLTDQSRS